MKHHLDPQNAAFVQAIADIPAPHVLGPDKTFAAFESLQLHEPAMDNETETVHVPAEDGSTTKVVSFRPRLAKKPCNMIFYSHGGGWIMGSSTSFAPAQRFPYQFEQTYNVLEYFVRNGQGHGLSVDSIALADDNAGHMSIAMMQMLIERKLSVNIGQIILFNPVTVTDTHKNLASYTTFKDDLFLPAATQDWTIETMLPNQSDRETALASPLRYLADEILVKFAPTTIILAAVDPLLDEGLEFGKRL
ncbi:vegetative specific protein H5 [Phaeosphaeria sp. MPI-PUGE-AT-0046c]|nr:vegetative specific protein H5 [Phaeosphaeria sp. MPI-PUGE-AT-0046c]